MAETCRTCRFWKNINGGQCHYEPPPVVVAIYRMLAAEPGTHIDWNGIIDGVPEPVPAEHFCSEYQLTPDFSTTEGGE